MPECCYFGTSAFHVRSTSWVRPFYVVVDFETCHPSILLARRTRPHLAGLRSLAYFFSLSTCVSWTSAGKLIRFPISLQALVVSISLLRCTPLPSPFWGTTKFVPGKRNICIALPCDSPTRPHFGEILSGASNNASQLILQEKFSCCYSGSYKKFPGDAVPKYSPMPRHAQERTCIDT